MTQYNFNNPDIQAKATELARGAIRPTSYNTPKKIALELKREMMREEILKNGFLDQIQPVLEEITQVMIENAKTPKGVADRKNLLKAMGMFRVKSVAELDWESKAEERARSKRLADQLMSIGKPSLNRPTQVQ